MHVTRVLIQEQLLIKQVLVLLDRSRQALDEDGSDNITVVVNFDTRARPFECSVRFTPVEPLIR